MTEPDDIDRALSSVLAEYYGPPSAADLAGLSTQTVVVGLSYGFDDWSDVRVAANSKRYVAVARRHWSDGEHPSAEFLAETIGESERAIEHRRLLARAHPNCSDCDSRVIGLRRAATADLDHVDPDTVPDALDIAYEWLTFEPGKAVRSDRATPRGALRATFAALDAVITATQLRSSAWRITIRREGGRTAATVRIEWSTGAVTQHRVVIELDKTDLSLAEPGRPLRVSLSIDEASDSDGT
jgi:hypothetical protein